ncbi:MULTISPECIES: caspase family protein [Fischerella]|uniref:Peptidase C14 n=1 Tax=Fischerella muscicola CCMEE 5323 TaxID=2019572 RepID=A0A2N6JYS8_FISMU|nr:MULTISPECIES: caspase family protein [Fischerella]PLZ86192.1 peptidase C14 [Fischerella muscicola CCMEE 5323]
MRRRHFLQFAGSTLTTLGLSYLDIVQQGNRYAQVLAQGTPRKLALLVGINQYPASQRFTDLEGCVTDVELQQELLIHRFGFNKSDILRLTSDPSDKQPTRNNILTAFEEHLIKQAKPTDVVVFHFSGHGSQLLDPNPVQLCPNQQFNSDLNSSIVTAEDGQNKLVPDIMGRTLFLLMSALQTDNVSFVMDSCHSGGGTRGNFRIRSVPGNNLKPSSEEIAYQQRWLDKLQISPEEFAKRRCAGARKGVVLAGAQRDQDAADATFDEFFAGAFTYLLTQYLWQQTSNVGSAIAQLTSGLRVLKTPQQPLADGDQSQPVYFINKKLPPADAVITKVEGKQATIWLGGVDSESLESFGKGATFTIVDQKGQASAQVKLESRQGLIATARLQPGGIASMQPGMLLQESSRVVPATLKLTIGIDPSLAAETNAAKQALSQINRVEAVAAKSGNVPYPPQVQYILSRLTDDYRQQLQRQNIPNLPTVGSIGLFTKGLEFVPQSFGKLGETVPAAVSRLEPIIKSFLAVEIIKKTLNATSSQLDVEVSMNLVDQPNQTLFKTSTVRGKNNRGEFQQRYSQKLPLAKLFQFKVTNHESTPVYLTSLLVDSTGGLVVVFPYQWPATEESTLIAPKETRTIGDPQHLKLKAIDKGTGEVLVIVSRSPLKKAVKTLVALAAELNRSSGPVELGEPVEVIGDLLDDLSSDRSSTSATTDKEVKVSEIATLAIPFEVV